MVQEVTLKNGSTEALPLVTATMMSIEKVMEENPIAFYESVMFRLLLAGSESLRA
jgi:hypothetical protein